MLLRRQGKLAFATMRDSTGEIQLFALDAVTADFEEFSKLHLGDWVGVEGEVVRTKRGELSVKVATWERLAEAQHNFGDKWAGIADFDLRYRHREADLWANETARRSCSAAATMIRAVRERCWAAGFMEVETPILNPIPSGASARPFVTHHNALDSDFYLRIAPELWLKRLVVGGFERVFELGRVFRNEGVSPRHNPEFTMLELYAAYWNYEDMMSFTEELVAGVALDVLGTTEIEYQGDNSPSPRPGPVARWPNWRAKRSARTCRCTRRATCSPLLGERGVDVARRRGVPVAASPNSSSSPARRRCGTRLRDRVPRRGVTAVASLTVRPRTHRALRVLRRRARTLQRLLGTERSRRPTSALRGPGATGAAGDEETMPIDEDYIKRARVGTPTDGRAGVGMDRLAMLLADESNIREVIAFPTLKPLRD
jgi:lysyl-tRNA synthetase class 2